MCVNTERVLRLAGSGYFTRLVTLLFSGIGGRPADVAATLGGCQGDERYNQGAPGPDRHVETQGCVRKAQLAFWRGERPELKDALDATTLLHMHM